MKPRPHDRRPVILMQLATAVSCLVPIVAHCQDLHDTPAREAGGRTIAVMGFANTADPKAAAGFTRALQEMLTTDLAVSRDVRVVERTRLEEILKEQRLGKTEFLDPASAARVGKGLGAEAILTGSVWIQDEGMRIDARLVHVETGEIILPAKIEGKAAAFLDLEKQLAKGIVEALGARLSAFDKASLSKRHTSDINAATAFGQALEAEDAGNATLAREKAAVAVELDPDFALAANVVKQIDAILEEARTEDSLRIVGFLAAFERRLFDWPLEDSSDIVSQYRALLKDRGPRRALLHWLLNQQQRTFADGTATPYSMLFVHADEMNDDSSAGRTYLDARAGDIVTFWCDVAQSDPSLSPRRRITDVELNPDFRTLPASGVDPSYYFWRLPDIYGKRFSAAVHCTGDIASATRIAKEFADVCGAMGPAANLNPQLDALRGQLVDPDGQCRFKQAIRNSSLRWTALEDRVIDDHIAFQMATFPGKDATMPIPSRDEARAALEDMLANNPGPHLPEGDPVQRTRAAKRMITTLIDEADGADFVGFSNGTKADEDVGTMTVHLVGCPDCLTDPRVQILYPWLQRRPKPLAAADQCLEGRMIPCGTCRPLRWADRTATEQHLASLGDRLIEQAIQAKEPGWPPGLADVLGQCLSTPSAHLRDSLIALCKSTAAADDPDRVRQALAFRCLATVADDRDVAWLATVLTESPFFDIRANAGAVLGAIGGQRAVDALAVAIDREQFYFVRHFLLAAMTRAISTQCEKQVNLAYSLSASGQADKALQVLEAVLADMAAAPLRTTAKQRVLGVIYQALGDATISARRPLQNATRYYRRAVETFPEDFVGLPSALNALAYNLALQKDHLEEAEAAVRRALELRQKATATGGSGEDVAMLDTLAVVLLGRGKLDEAKEVMSRCVESPTGQTLETYDHWGDILWALDDHGAARQAWSRGLSLVADTADDRERAERVREKLAH